MLNNMWFWLFANIFCTCMFLFPIYIYYKKSPGTGVGLVCLSSFLIGTQCLWLPFVFVSVGKAIISVLGTVSVVVIFVPMMNRRKEMVDKRIAIEVEAERKNKENILNSIRFYNKCVENGIERIDGIETDETVKVIAKSFDFNTVEEIIVSFNKGKELVSAENEKKRKINDEEKQKEIEKDRQSKRSQFDGIKEKIKIVGKEKYFSQINREYVKIKEKYLKYANEKIDPNSFYMRPKKDNYGWVGGIAQGLAGPAAGLAAAMDYHQSVREHNEKARQMNLELISHGITPQSEQAKIDKKATLFKQLLTAIEESYESISSSLFDDENSEKILESLTFDITLHHCSKSGYLKLNVKIESSQAKILDKNAVIDGTLKIEVLDSKMNVVGEAYLIGNSHFFADSYSIEAIHLEEPKNYWHWTQEIKGFSGFSAEIYAIPTKSDCFDENETYTTRVLPIAIWKIENSLNKKMVSG